ncbi:MAG: ABC transporter permease [Acidimicrobiales bacterium]|jgi:peptide/nickel transport system permease protein|nr:ABC transporter permease [Acidimicrobiales bacterium]
MPKMIASRLLRLVLTLLTVSFATFVMVNVLPGDAINALIPIDAQQDQEFVEQVREEWGLNDPMLVRYGRWLGNAVTGDLGDSIVTGQPVTAEITHRLPITLEIMFVAVGLSLLLAVPVGVFSAYREGKRPDRVISGFAQLGLSMPVFVTGLILIYIFALKLNWFPATGWNRPSNGIGPNLKTVALPAMSLAITEAAVYTRVLRSDMISTLKENYILSARAKGLTDRFVLFRHGLRPSLLTLVTVVGLSVGTLIGGTLVVEFLFAIPGIGRRIFSAIYQRDFMMVQGITVLITAFYVIVNTVVDVAYMVIDPRIRRTN